MLTKYSILPSLFVSIIFIIIIFFNFQSKAQLHQKIRKLKIKQKKLKEEIFFEKSKQHNFLKMDLKN